MSSYAALSEIPDKWAEKGHCPICGNLTLRVVHHPEESDHLACVFCGCAFELEVDGPHIWLLRIGPEYLTTLMPAEGIWISTIELRRLLMTQPSVPVPAPVSIPISIPEKEKNPVYTTAANNFPDLPNTPDIEDLTQEEVERRAFALAELGNSASTIKTVLSGSGIPESQVSTALDEITTKRVKKKSPLPLALAVTILVITACLSAAAIYLPKINLLSLVAPFSPELTAVAYPQRNIKITPIPSGSGLPANGAHYFDVIWNLTGNYTEKGSQVNSVIAPSELNFIQMQLVERFSKAGILESAYLQCQSEYDEKKCSETPALDTDYCKVKSGECTRANVQFIREQTTLYDYWLVTACKTFEEYYSKNNATFPFPPGTCKYP
jgi:hypothetical protein